MIGVFSYTVILTYLSLLSASAGIIITTSGLGHPYIGTIFLLLCALFDAFDGKVARMKKNRTQLEMNFGIQIDSLSDIVAFGVLPACIGSAMLRRSTLFNETIDVFSNTWYCVFLRVVLVGILMLYVLAGLIRLAYYNVTEEERQETEGNTKRKYYVGVPITVAAFTFSLVQILQYLLPFDVTPVYFVCALGMAFGFVANIQVPKPGKRGIFTMIGIGIAEIVILLVLNFFFWD